MVHSRDHKGVGIGHKYHHPNQPQRNHPATGLVIHQRTAINKSSTCKHCNTHSHNALTCTHVTYHTKQHNIQRYSFSININYSLKACHVTNLGSVLLQLSVEHITIVC